MSILLRRPQPKPASAKRRAPDRKPGRDAPTQTPKTEASLPRLAAAELIGRIRTGLPVGELDALQIGLQMPLDALALKLGISKATLHRRKLAGRLEPDESDRVVRFARLLSQAGEVLESAETARRWLRSPQLGLGGAIPLVYADTEVGARAVEDLLGRIEFGVYS